LPKTKPTPFLKVLLVVLLCSVELLGRKNLSNNRPVQLLLLLFQRFPGSLLLLFRVVVYSRSVLCSHIIPLPQRTRSNKKIVSKCSRTRMFNSCVCTCISLECMDLDERVNSRNKSMHAH